MILVIYDEDGNIQKTITGDESQLEANLPSHDRYLKTDCEVCFHKNKVEDGVLIEKETPSPQVVITLA